MDEAGQLGEQMLELLGVRQGTQRPALLSGDGASMERLRYRAALRAPRAGPSV